MNKTIKFLENQVDVIINNIGNLSYTNEVEYRMRIKLIDTVIKLQNSIINFKSNEKQ